MKKMVDEMSYSRKVDKKCINGCGKDIYWDKSIEDSKLKWAECDSGIHHTYKRCADVLKSQGKDATEMINTAKRLFGKGSE